MALTLFLMSLPGIAEAIPKTCEVTLESESGPEITLVSIATAEKTKLAEELAVKQAFFGIINQGIEGLYSGQPMLTAPNKAFDYTFYKENKYQNYLTSTPVRLDETKVGSMKRVRMRVTINLTRLKKDLTSQNLSLSPAWQDKKATSATVSLNPTIVVVPYVGSGDQSFESMKDLIDANPAMKHAVNKVSAQFASHGYKTRDFVTMLNNSKSDDILHDGTQADARTMMIQQLPADIVVSVNLDLFKDGNKGQCTLALDAVERQTAGKLCAESFASGQYMTTDYIALTDYALKKVENGFFSQMQKAFEDMVQKGREMKLEFLLGDTVTDWDFDVETPATGEDFKDELEEWLRATANHGVFDMSRSTDKFIEASINIPLWDTERNRSYTINNFNSSLRKFMKTHFGDAYKAKVTSLGQKLSITIE